jgi:hypothetical protein
MYKRTNVLIIMVIDDQESKDNTIFELKIGQKLRGEKVTDGLVRSESKFRLDLRNRNFY